MLFKISLSNIRKSIKDYAVYFFTLVLGVAVFYIFNAIETQTAFIRASEEQRELIKILITAISGVSVFIAIVLGLLIVYASRFLMKRRNREFALYMMLGMSKWRISAILLCETVIIGIGSLFVGLLLGVGFSQVMSAVVANLFEADMDDYRFTVSASAITKTMLYFGIMYLVVMLRSGFVISKCRLITLMNSGRRSEKITMKNPWLCVIVFLISAAALGWAYHTVGWDFEHISVRRIGLAILAGSIATFCSRNAPESHHVRKRRISQRTQQLHVPSAQQQGKHDRCFHDSYLPYAFRDHMHALNCVHYQELIEQGR